MLYRMAKGVLILSPSKPAIPPADPPLAGLGMHRSCADPKPRAGSRKVAIGISCEHLISTPGVAMHTLSSSIK